MDPRTEKMLAERRQEAEARAARPRGAATIEDTKGWLARNRLAMTIAASAVVAVLALARHLLVTVPARERELATAQMQAQQQTESDAVAKQEALDVCLTTAQADYTAVWDGACKARKARTGCALPKDVVADQERRRVAAHNDCLKRYSLH